MKLCGEDFVSLGLIGECSIFNKGEAHMQNNELATSTVQEESPIFGLRYLEENEADILEVAGCQGLVAADDGSDAAITYKLCGDGWDNSSL